MKPPRNQIPYRHAATFIKRMRSRGWGGNKYKAIRTAVDGIEFDSKREAEFYRKLLLLKKAGEIVELELQPEFSILDVAKYRADFRVKTKEGETVIYDVKGFRTPLYRLKKKLVEAIHGVVIREV